MRRFSFRLASSFRNRMILIFFLIIIAPFLIFAYYAHIKSIEGITITNEKMSLSYMQQAKRNFENYLQKLNDEVNDLIGDRRIQSLLLRVPATPEEEKDFTVDLLTVVYQLAPKIDAFRVRVYPIRPGAYASYMNMIGESVGVAEEDWFRQSSGKVSPSWYFSMPEKDKYARPLLTYVKRFSGLYDQMIRGLVAADLSEDHLKKYLSPADQLKNQKLLLLGEDGTVYYDSKENEWAGSVFPSAAFVEDVHTGREGSKTIEIGKNTYLATYIRMDNEPWSIVSLTLLKELTGPNDEMNRLLIAFLSVYLICCLGVVIYITVYYTQPIAHLVRLMRRLETRSFHNLQPWASRNDEVGWLYRGIGSLTERVEELVEEASRSERKKKALEFQVLSHQINPHFLYNTLESIRWKAENHGRNDISEMVSALGNLLRLSLNQGREMTTLRREIEQVKAYVQIEQARMGRPVRILYSFDPDIVELPFMRLLLQPLIENAIQHSVRNDFDRGKIALTGRREGNDIVIAIADNGGGIPDAVLACLEREEPEGERPSSVRGGVGLRNVNERLKLYFGPAYRLRIETGPDTGTKISLRHPVLNEGEAPDRLEA